ncbi:MAG: hypothetical protein WEE36_06820 [Acidimicrobiia bacterium]
MERDEPTQSTDQGLEIPVPKKGEFFKNLERAAKPTPWWRRLWTRRSEK